MSEELIHPYFNSGLSNTKQEVRDESTELGYYHFENTNSSNVYIQFFDADADNVTVGTTTPDMVLFVPANGGVEMNLRKLFSFSYALTIAATTTATGSSAPSSAILTTLGLTTNE